MCYKIITEAEEQTDRTNSNVENVIRKLNIVSNYRLNTIGTNENEYNTIINTLHK